jgi:hypothetical protein
MRTSAKCLNSCTGTPLVLAAIAALLLVAVFFGAVIKSTDIYVDRCTTDKTIARNGIWFQVRVRLAHLHAALRSRSIQQTNAVTHAVCHITIIRCIVSMIFVNGIKLSPKELRGLKSVCRARSYIGS